MRISSLGTAGALALCLFAAERESAACGGCFVPVKENTVVTGHRMAVAISMTQSVLWDQIQYSGDPAEFSWVLPVRADARLEIAHDAWFEVLDAATNVTIQAPPTNCGPNGGGFGCGSSSNDSAKFSGGSYLGNDGVEVLHQATVGPYETVTLSSKTPGALDKWLADHGYNVPEGIKPVIQAYIAEGFDFLALKLIPGEGVSAMKPVRVITPGAGFALPLRMVGAGTGATTAIKLFVIAEGRYHTKNFADAMVSTAELRWDYDTSSSNYGAVRSATLAQNDGQTFLTSYAKRRTLLGGATGFYGSYYGVGYGSIGDSYFRQGANDGEPLTSLALNHCADRLSGYFDSLDTVVTDCDAGGTCTTPPPGSIGASGLACGKLDDLAVALTGMHPHDVWLTRLEAELPRAGLAKDLILEAAPSQVERANLLIPERYLNHPCNFDNALALPSRPSRPAFPGGVVLLGIGLAALGWAMRRRAPVWASR